MATESGIKDPAVIADQADASEVERLLRDSPGSFDFFQAVRLILRTLGGDTGALRFEARKSLAFPPSQIDSLDWDEESVRMVVSFMGLTGPMGVLPRSYSDLVTDRLRNRDRGLADFLDILNDRMIRLFYKAWEKHRFPVTFERDEQDRLTRYLTAFIGLATPGLQNRLAVRDRSMLLYAGLLGLQPRSATTLEQIIESYFEVPAAVEQFVGSWQQLPASDVSVFDASDSYSEQLGVGAVVGDAIWDQQSRIRVTLGPMKEREYLEFLPTGKAWEALRAVTTFFCGMDIEVEVQLVLDRNDVPQCELGDESEAGPRLGWFTWMKSSPEFDRNPADTVLVLT